MTDDLDPAAVERVARGLFLHEYPGSEGGWDAPGDLGKAGWHAKARAALAAAGLLVTPEHDAQVAARALREAAEAVEAIDPSWDSALCIDRVYHPVPDWLRARADRIERQEEVSDA